MHVPVRSDWPSVLKRNGCDMADFPKKQATIFFCALRDFLSFWGGGRPKTAKPLTASWFPDHIRIMSALPRSILNGLDRCPVIVRLSTSGGSILHIVFCDTKRIVQYGHELLPSG